MAQFGDRIRELRLERRITQEELAKAFNTGKGSISHYEKNKRLPDPETVADYAKFFDVSIDYIMGKSTVRNHEKSVLSEKEKLIKEIAELKIDEIRAVKEVIDSGVSIEMFKHLVNQIKKSLQSQGI